MATYFISTWNPLSSNEDSIYQIDPQSYAQSMNKRWRYANIGGVSFEHYVLSWELNKEEVLGASGGLQANKKVVSFSSNPKEDAVDFVLWHRAFVPKEHHLYLFDESLRMIYELKSDLSEDDLRQIFY